MKHIFNYFQMERNKIIVALFFLIMNQTEFRWVHNQKENCHYNHIPFNLRGIRERFSVCTLFMRGNAYLKVTHSYKSLRSYQIGAFSTGFSTRISCNPWLNTCENGSTYLQGY